MRKILFTITTCLFLLSFQGIGLSQVVPGEKITKENWQKVKDLLPMSVLEWVKKGDLIMQTGNVKYNYWRGSEKMQKACKENKVKYELDKDDNIVDKLGKQTDFLYGEPFPEPDPSDPKAGVKVVWNFYYNQYKMSNFIRLFDVAWVGRKGFERKIDNHYLRLFYDGRPDDPIKNPDNVVLKEIIAVVAPYDVAGIGALLWRRKGGLSDDLWAYAPALRRTRKVSPTNRSDAYVGSHFCNDDANGIAAKVQTFTWKCLGEKKVLAPFFGEKSIPFVYDEKYKGWAVPKDFPYAKFGYEVKDWSGAPWIPANAIWSIRPVYVIEGNSKDPYYNYGKQIFYLDKETYNVYYKEIYDRGGKYWKTFYQGNTDMYAPTTPVEYTMALEVFEAMVDSKTDSASVSHTLGTKGLELQIYNSKTLGEDDFTIKALLKYGK